MWGYSIMAAGPATTPPPLLVALLSPRTGRLSERIGHRAVAVPGALVMAIGVGLLVARVGPESTYWTVFLPSGLLTALGVAATLPILSAAAVSEIPPPRFALAGSVNQMARQLGGAIGVALVIAVTGEPAASAALSAYRRGYLFVVAMMLLAAAVLLALPRHRRAGAEAAEAPLPAHPRTPPPLAPDDEDVPRTAMT